MITITYDPATHVLVPRQMTDKMRDRGNEIALDRDKLVRSYTAMLAAAPAPVVGQQDAPAVVAEGLTDLVHALRNIRDYRTDVDAMIAARSMRFYAEQALTAHPVAGSPAEPKLCDFGNQDDFDDAHDEWERAQRYAVVGAMEYNGNTVSYMYSKAKNYGNVLVDCCTLIGGEGHIFDRIKSLIAERDALRLAAAEPMPASEARKCDLTDYRTRIKYSNSTAAPLPATPASVQQGAALAMLRYVLPYIPPRACDAAKARSSSLEDCYINTQVRRFLEATLSPAVDDLAIEIERGTKAWADVPDAMAYLEDLRGNAPAVDADSVRDAALEEAASLCNAHAKAQHTLHQHSEMYVADHLARAIRALKTSEGASRG